MSSWTQPGLMSSSMPINVPLRASAPARFWGVVDMLAAYMRLPALSWPRALRATYGACAVGRAAPPPPPCRLPGRLPVQQQRPQILPDAVRGLARGRRGDPPHPDPRAPASVDDEAGQLVLQRLEHVPFLLIPARVRALQETAVEGGEHPPAFRGADHRPGPDQATGRRHRV